MRSIRLSSSESVKTGVLCPSSFEYRFLSSLPLTKHRARLFVSGMGKIRAMHACHEFFRTNPQLERILLIGYAGSLSSGLVIGDLIEPDEIIEQDYDARPLERFPHRIRTKKKLLSYSKTATMLTQDRFMKENPFKGTPLAQKYPRLACDMEAYAVALFCQTKKLSFSAIKLISDEANEDAEHDFLKACRRLAPKMRESLLEVLIR